MNSQTTTSISEPASQQQGNGSAKSAVSQDILQAIYGNNTQSKKEAYENSLRRWWSEYADRKNDEEDEYVANSLLYDRNHLPRSAPAPDCVQQDNQGPSTTPHRDADAA